MSWIENIDNLSAEEFLGPPKYDSIGVFMIFLTGMIVWVVSGAIILLFALFSIGKFSLESGASPMLLAMITFFALTIGNLITYSIRSYIFPHIYSRGRTAVSQIAIMSIILYIFFVPIYMVMPVSAIGISPILLVFSIHILVNVLSLELLMGLISQYRYSLLSLYSSIVAFLLTGITLFAIQTQFSSSVYIMFLLFGLTMLAYLLGGFISTLISWIYYLIYRSTGKDPIGTIFSRIEEEEREMEKQATATLTKF